MQKRFHKRCAVLGALFLSISFSGCATQQVAQHKKIEDPHHHFGGVVDRAAVLEIMKAHQFKLITNPPAPRENGLKSNGPGGVYEIYVAEMAVEGLLYTPEHIFLKNTRSGEVWMLRNVLFSHRPISNLTWLDSERVCFDIGTTPHYGVHFLIDATMPGVIHVAHYHDDFIEQLERSGDPSLQEE